MPEIKDVPDALRPYRFHGVRLEWDGRSEWVHAETCPLCIREGKFGVEIATGRFKCLKCGEVGNIFNFFQKFWERSYDASADYDELAKNRGLLDGMGLAAWGVCRSVTTNDWIVPGYTDHNSIKNLYKWKPQNGKFVLLATPTVGHGIHGVPQFDKKKGTVYVCEGWGDGIALWEALGQLKEVDGEYVPTGNVEKSLLANANVVAIPGCGSVGTPFEYWLSLFNGKRVVLLFDNDHPRTHTNGSLIEGGALAATRRAVRLLSEYEAPPESVEWLQWGKDGYDSELPSGYDLRDVLKGDMRERGILLKSLLSLVQPVPSEWVTPKSNKPIVVGVGCTPCIRYGDLVRTCRQAMKWTEGLDMAFSVMLACVVSTKTLEDQLWVRIMGPASCGKSTLCEAISTAVQYVMAKSTLRGFHSGATDDSGDDFSLIAKVKDKTLVIKDADTLLQAPNLSQILSEARDLYDTTSRSSYRHKQGGRDYTGIRMGFILCGTSSLRKLDRSELGQRFIDCVIMESIDDELEDEIIWRVVNRTERNMAFESDGDAKSLQNPEMTLMMQMSGGYVCYLRENAGNLIAAVDMPDDAKHICGRLGKFIAFMRARPSDFQDETTEREVAFRLVSQMTKLTKCLAVVLNKTVVNHEVLARSRKVAMDTSRGVIYNLSKELFHHAEGMLTAELAFNTNRHETQVRRYMQFLRHIGAVVLLQPEAVNGVKQKNRWHLTSRLRRLWEEVHETN